MLMLHVPLSACEGERGRWGLWGLLVVQLGFCVDGTLLPKYFLLWFLSLWSVNRWSRIRWVARWCQRRGGRGRRGTWGWWRSWSFAGSFRLGVGVFGTLVPCRSPLVNGLTSTVTGEVAFVWSLDLAVVSSFAFLCFTAWSGFSLVCFDTACVLLTLSSFDDVSSLPCFGAFGSFSGASRFPALDGSSVDFPCGSARVQPLLLRLACYWTSPVAVEQNWKHQGPVQWKLSRTPPCSQSL